MQENKKRESLESLREELKWYTLYASDEEYDEKAVESIMYLLDRWEPLEEGTVPPVEESWKRFLKVAGGKELLPLGDVEAEQKPAGKDGVVDARKPVIGKNVAVEQESVIGENAAKVLESAVAGSVSKMQKLGEDVALAQDGRSESGFLTMQEKKTGEGLPSVSGTGDALRFIQKAKTEGEMSLIGGVGEDKADNIVQMSPEEDENSDVGRGGRHSGRKKSGKLAKFASRHKIIVAAVLVLMVLMVGNTIHAVANPETGFFFWLNRDDSGVKMMTSPEGLDGVTNKPEDIFYNREDAPEWAQDWIEIETGIGFETQDAYELQYFEISELETRQHVTSYFICEDSKKDIVVGVWIYWDGVSYFSEDFLEYDYVQSYEFEQKEMDIYKRMESTGQVYYTVCFYEGNCKYFVKGWENLDEIKKIAEDYWRCVQNNY